MRFFHERVARSKITAYVSVSSLEKLVNKQPIRSSHDLLRMKNKHQPALPCNQHFLDFRKIESNKSVLDIEIPSDSWSEKAISLFDDLAETKTWITRLKKHSVGFMELNGLKYKFFLEKKGVVLYTTRSKYNRRGRIAFWWRRCHVSRFCYRNEKYQKKSEALCRRFYTQI